MEYTVLPFVEIEVRLGTISFNKFDSNIDKNYFKQIGETLNTSELWESINQTDTVEFIKDNLRLITGKQKDIIFKENIYKKTIQVNNSPFDIRFAVNQEFKMNSSLFIEKDCVVRKKQRTSYISKNYQYDLTYVKQTINNVTKDKYEIEIELRINQETLSWSKEYLNDFLECKIYDLINIVEPLKREDFKIHLNN